MWVRTPTAIRLPYKSGAFTAITNNLSKANTAKEQSQAFVPKFFYTVKKKLWILTKHFYFFPFSFAHPIITIPKSNGKAHSNKKYIKTFRDIYIYIYVYLPFYHNAG